MEKSPTSREQLGILFKWKNLFKTVSTLIPGTGPMLEIQNQLEGEAIQKNLQHLESTNKEHSVRLKQIEEANPSSLNTVEDWPYVVADYSQRLVGIGVVYDGGIHSPEQNGEELIQTVAHGCFVDKNEVLTCSEALALAYKLAELRKGKAVIFHEVGWFDFDSGEIDKASGLVILKTTERYTARWQKAAEEYGLKLTIPLETKVKSTIQPWIGQDIGFIHEGEAKNVMGYPKYQFDSSAISHFRQPSDYALKVFVTGVLSGRILMAGAPVFTRQGTLVGILADTEHYESDAGRRAVIKSLLGHPKYTAFSKSTK